MFKKVIALSLLYIFVIYAIVNLATFPRPVVELQEKNSALSVEGFIQAIYTGKNIFALRTAADNDFVITTATSTKIRNNLGQVVDFTVLEPGMEVNSLGMPTISNRIAAESILIIKPVE